MIPKFRAWGAVEHKMVQVVSLNYGSPSGLTVNGSNMVGLVESLMQCTGFGDVHDTSIYVGDILKDDYGRILEVEWYGYRFRFKAIAETNFTYAYQICDWFGVDMVRPEIIGNIYENPDMVVI